MTLDSTLRKAVENYNKAVSRLCENYNKTNEIKAYEKINYLKGVKDTIKALGYGVYFEYKDSSFFSEIENYIITVK